MKKDTYPDIRIEVLSEGLAKKILGKVEDAPPSVYGEEKPTSATIPDINAKGVNKDMAEALETSHKKPNYTGIIKEAMLELSKDSEKMPEETGKPDYQERTEFQERYMLGDDYPRFGTKFTEEDGRTTQYRAFPDYTTLTNGDQNFSMGTASEYYEGDKPAPEGLATKRYNLPKDDVLSQSTYDPRTGIETTAGTYYGPGTSKYHAGTDTWMEEPGGVPRGFYQKITRPTSKDAPTGASTTEYARSLETKALVKEAIQELRKAPEDQYGQFQPGGDIKGTKQKLRATAADERLASTIGDTSPESKKLQSTPTSESTKSGETKWIPPTPVTPFGSKVTTTEAVENVRGTMTGTPDETAPGMRGAGGIRRLYSIEPKPKIGDPSTDYSMGPSAARSKDPGIDYGSLGTRETGTKGTGTSAGDKGKGLSGKGTKTGGDTSLQFDPGTGKPTAAVAGLTPEEGGEKEIKPDGGPTDGGPSVEDVSGKVAANVTGIDPTIIDEIEDEIEKPVGQINSEITRPNNPTDSNKKLPQFGSSGYFDAVLQIGEGNTIERDGGQVPLSSVNYGVNSLAEFLELYPQNETFDKDKFLDTLTTEKSITKAQNPKSITAKPTANVNGVNVSSTVVSGAGTMKTLEKTGKGLNKPKELGASKKTRATKINPKNIQTKAVMKSERPAMDNTLRYIIKEAIEEIKIDKARKTSKDIGSRMGPQRKETEGGEAGKSWSQRAEYRGDIANIAKAALEKQGADDPSTFSSQRQAYGDTTTAQMDKTTGLREGSAFKRMGDTGTDAYGSEEQFIVNPDKGVGPQEVSVPKLNTRPEVYRGQ